MYIKQNLYKYEKELRTINGIAFIGAAIYFNIWWLAVIGIFSFLTSSYGHCPLYSVTGVNEDGAKRSFYLSQFPIYNPEPTILIRKNGLIAFKNEAASEIFKDVESIDEIFPKDKSLATLVKDNANVFNKVEVGEYSYMIHFKGVSEIDAILAFCFNISDIVKMNKEIVNTQKDIVYRMGEIGETRSKETGNHVKRVAEYSYILAKAYGLDEEEANTLKIASPMHDIGKVGIPDAVLNKPGKLDKQEWEIMQTHAQIGYEMLKNSDRPILKSAAIVAREHHEKWNGSGYPRALKEEEIHIYGRITAVADVFDALGSHRVYKEAWELDRVLDLFKEERGKHFDPNLIDLMFENLDAFLEIRDKYKDS